MAQRRKTKSQQIGEAVMASETIEVTIKTRDNFFTQRRLGRITITLSDALFDADKILQLMSHFVVLRTRESMFAMNDVEYIVASPLLPPIREGEMIPEYEWEMRDYPTGEVELVKITRADNREVVYPNANQAQD
jgi:hypothetical protein